MEEVWRRNAATVRDVLDALNRDGAKQRAYTTIMTIMSRLDEKGLLTRQRRGRADLYRPVMSREDYQRARARSETDALVADYGEVALAHFARQLDSLDARRLRELRRLAAEDS